MNNANMNQANLAHLHYGVFQLETKISSYFTYSQYLFKEHKYQKQHCYILLLYLKHMQKTTDMFNVLKFWRAKA